MLQWPIVINLEYNIGDSGSLPEVVNKSLFSNPNIKSSFLKTNEGETESLILLFSSLKCFSCRWMDGGGVEQRLLFGAC